MGLNHSTERINQRTAEIYDQNQRERKLWADVHGQWSLLVPGIETLGIGIWKTPALLSTKPGWPALLLGLILVGGLLTLAAFKLIKKCPGQSVSRYLIAITQMVWAMGLIPVFGGQPEAYLFVFLAIAMLSFYRDWTVLALAAVVLLAGQLVLASGSAWFVNQLTAVDSFSLFHWMGWIAAACLCLGLFNGYENRRLRQYCRRLAELEQSNRDVEQIIWDRTKELKTINRHLKSEVKSRVKAESERERLMRKLIHASREADRSEVATGALQSVGITVNRLKNSLETILERLNSSRIGRLEQAAQMLNRNPADLAEFLTNTDRGRQFPEFFQLMADQLSRQVKEIRNEVLDLQAKVSHVAEIVLIQQPYDQIAAALEEFSVNDVCEEAIKICKQAGDGNAIQITRDYASLPMIRTERNRVRQIIVNLLSNAQHAVLKANTSAPEIQIGTAIVHPAVLTISVKDNGIGLNPERLSQIFHHGFTTRDDGRGFGLHSSLLMAHELHGKLECVGSGKDRGAEFVLTLPIEESAMKTIDAEMFFNPI